MTARKAKRIEARDTAREITRELYPGDREWLASFIPLYDLSDCEHGCNGSPCGSERCTFVCHPAPSGLERETLGANFGLMFIEDLPLPPARC